MIWTYAFGNRTLHPVTSREPNEQFTGKITFFQCQEEFSDQEIYEMSRMGAADDNEYRWKARALSGNDPSTSPYSLEGMHTCKRYPEYEVDFLQEGPICRQIWREVKRIKWKKTVFCFTESWDFKDFAKHARKKTVASYIGDLVIEPAHLIEEITYAPGNNRGALGSLSSGHLVRWSAVLTPENVECFKGLVGIHLVVDWFKNPPRNPCSEYLGRVFQGRNSHIPLLWKEFQALSLKKERTTVWITGRQPLKRAACKGPNPSVTNFKVTERLKIADMVEGLLLDWKPRRRSRRRGA